MSAKSSIAIAILMLLCTLSSPAMANSEIISSNRDASGEITNSNSIDLLVIYPETEHETTHIDDLSSDYGETTVDGYLDKLILHVNSNYARSSIGAQFNLLPSVEVNFSHLGEDWKSKLSLAMMNPHNSPYTDYIAELNKTRNLTNADVMVYWRESGDGGPGAAGGASAIPAEEDEAYVQINHHSMSPYILSHELGHLLGGEHHKGTQTIANISVDGGEFENSEIRTLMTSQATPTGYPVVRVWAFSDANATVNGTIPCGYGLEPSNCTYAEDSSIGNSSWSNADLMRVRAPIMAGFRSPVWEWPDPLPHQNQDIMGGTHLDIQGTILESSDISASWNANISIRDDYGIDLLPDMDLGVRYQIDQHMGNGDGWLSIPEIADFVTLIETARNLSDSELLGCCMIDYASMQAEDGMIVTVTPPANGSVDSNGSWGWIESAELTGMTDSRSTRILDIPRVGGVIEEIPLRVTLPENWEFRYSAMLEIIEGSPGDFTIHRQDAPVASDIRISLGRNSPPNANAERETGISTIPLGIPTKYSGECTDSALDSTTQWWTLHRNGTMMSMTHSNVLEFTASELNFTHGEVASVVMHCMDSFSHISTWSDNVVIDGIKPTWNAVFQVNIDGIVNDLDSNLANIEIPSGSHFYFSFNANDENGLPVNIKVTSNKSQGWVHSGEVTLEFADYFYQSEQINGMHLNVTERHKAKESSKYNLSLSVTDDASNTATHEWIVVISDGAGPTIIPDIISNGTSVSPDSPARADEEIILSLTESFDDLDAIDDVIWEVRVDEEVIAETALWDEVEKLTLPLNGSGTYLVHILAWDSSDNKEEISFGLTVSPGLGVYPSVLSHRVVGELVEDESVKIIVTMQNTGADIGSGVLCSGDVCSDDFVISAADSTSPSIFSAELVLNLTSTDPIDLRLEWSSDSAGSEGVIDIDNKYVVVSQWQMPMQVLLGVLSVLMMLAWLVHRTWGAESQRP